MTGKRRSPEVLAHLRRARDLIDREFAEPLDVPSMARRAFMSPAHFSREFRAVYGETPYGYLMTRRVERAMALLRVGSTVTEACTAVGATSLGSFSSSFTRLVGETPSSYRSRRHEAAEAMPSCIARLLTRPTRYLDPGPGPGAGPARGVGVEDRAGSEKPAQPHRS